MGGGGGSTSTTNNGTITVEPSGSLRVGGYIYSETFTNAGGSIGNNGTITMANMASFIQRGGTESGAAVALNNGSTLDDDTTAAAANFNVPQNGTTLTGSGASPGIAAGQVLTVAANNTQVNLGVSLTNKGAITLGDAGNGPSILCCAGVTLTNTGHLNTVAGGGGSRFLHTDLINTGSGTIDLAGPTIQDGSGGGTTATTNNGTVVVEPSGSLTLGNYIYDVSLRNAGGSVTNNGVITLGNRATCIQRGGTESGAPVVLNAFSTLDDDSTAAAALFRIPQNPITVTGSGASPGIGSGQVLTVAGSDAQVNFAVNLTNKGTITLGDASNGPSILCCAGVTLTNTGHLNTIAGGGGSRFLHTNLINASGGNVDIAGPTLQDGSGGATTTTNNGTVTIGEGDALGFGGGSTFSQGANGTFATTIDGTTSGFGQMTGGGDTLNFGGKLTVTTVGHPAIGSSWSIISGANRVGQFATHDFGAARYDIQYPAAGVTLVYQGTCDYWIAGNGNFNTPANWSTGAVPNSADNACITQTTSSTPPATADTYTVLFDGNVTVGSLELGAPTGKQTLQLAGNNTQFFLSTTGTINGNGALLVGDSNVSNGYTWLGAGGGSSLLTNNGMLKTVQGGGGIRYLRVNITNAAGGTMDVAAVDTRVDSFGSSLFTTTNDGTFIVEAGATFAFSNGGSFVNQGGSVTNTGAFSQTGGHFIQRGGSESGNPVLLQAGGFDDDLSAAPAKFTISCPSCPPYPLTGTGAQPGVAAGQVITIAGDNSWVDLGVSFTNAGTIVLGDAGSGYSVLRGGTNSVVLTNTGHLNTVSGGGGIRYLRVNVTNAAGGIVDVAAPDSRQDSLGVSTVNNGAFIVAVGSTMSFSEGSNFTQGSGGTYQTTINANTSSFGQLNGGGDAVTLNGTLKVNTVGRPAVGSTWQIISNANRSGTFGSQDFGGWNYTVQYHATDVTLVAQGTCDVWTGGVDNNFNTAGNWSLGYAPGGADDACITATTTTNPPANADTYTVVANTNPTVHSLALGGPNGTQTLLIPSSFIFNIGADSSIGAHGVLILGDSGVGATGLGCSGSGCTANGPTITDAGTLKTVQGDGSARRIQQVLIANATGGTTDVGGNTLLQGGCQPGGGLNNNKGFLNSGAVTVRAGGILSAECGFVNNSGATVANQGSFSVGGSVFKQRGMETGNAVVIISGSTLDDDTSAGAGAFVLTGAADGLNGTGTSPGIAAGQFVTVASGTTVSISPPMTNAGTLSLGDSGSGDTALCCEYFTAPATITNAGMLKTVQGGGGIRRLQVNIANATGGTIDLAANDTRQDAPCGDNATWITNSGTFTLEATSHFTIGNCPGTAAHADTFTAQSVGKFQTTINASTTHFGQLTGGVVDLAGTLKVTTIGLPQAGSSWPILSGTNRSGQFTVLDVTYPYYDVQVQYTSTGVNVVYNPRSISCSQTSKPWFCHSGAGPTQTPPGPWWKRH